jgi:hypothetical protein
MNRHVKEFLIDALHLAVPVVFISFALVSVYARETSSRSLKSSPTTSKNAKHRIHLSDVR